VSKPTLSRTLIALASVVIVLTGCGAEPFGAAQSPLFVDQVKLLCRQNYVGRPLRFFGAVTFIEVNSRLILVQDATAGIRVGTSFDPDNHLVNHGVEITGKIASGANMTLRPPSAAVVLRPAPWLTQQRTFQAFAVTMLLVAFALIWVWVLRRRVRGQTKLIAQKLAEVELLKEKAEAASRAKSVFLANMSNEGQHE
jgi:hypothetical protein